MITVYAEADSEKPEDSLSVLLSFDSRQVLRVSDKLFRANLNPTAEFIERKVIQLGKII